MQSIREGWNIKKNRDNPDESSSEKTRMPEPGQDRTNLQKSEITFTKESVLLRKDIIASTTAPGGTPAGAPGYVPVTFPPILPFRQRLSLTRFVVRPQVIISSILHHITKV